jgi:rod shape-determining protein MreD
VRALRFVAALVAALLGHLVLVALVPPSAWLLDPFLLATAYLAMTSRPGGAAAQGAAIGLVHDGLSGGLYGLQGFACTLVGFMMARTVRLVDLHKSYYVALYFACSVLLQQLVLQGLLLLLTQQPEVIAPLDLLLRVALAGPVGALVVAACEHVGQSWSAFRARRRAEIFLE